MMFTFIYPSSVLLMQGNKIELIVEIDIGDEK